MIPYYVCDAHHMGNNKHTSYTQDFSTYKKRRSTSVRIQLRKQYNDKNKLHYSLTQTKRLRQILGRNTTLSEYTSFFLPHNSGCLVPKGELDDWRLTIINRQRQKKEQLQENPTIFQELQRRLEGYNWTGETRFRRKKTPTRRATSKTNHMGTPQTRARSNYKHHKGYGDLKQHPPKILMPHSQRSNP